MKLLNLRLSLLISGLVVFFWCSCNSEESPKIVVYNSLGKTIVNNTGIVDFGICSVEDVTEKTFAITNISNEDLELTGNPYVEITGEETDTGIRITDENYYVDVYRNKINVDGAYGIYIVDSNRDAIFFNNMVWGPLNSVVYDFDNQGGFEYYYNTFRNTATGGSYKAYYGRRLNASYHVDYFQNNLLSTVATSTYTICISGTGDNWQPTSASNISNNLYNYNYVSNIAYFNGACALLYHWINATNEATCYDGNPEFVSGDSCYIDDNSDCQGRATIIGSISTDIDGTTRDASSPDIGAHENTN